MLIYTNLIEFPLQAAASNHLWPQFEIVNEDECEAMESSQDGCDKSMVSQSQMDESVKSLVDTFEVGVIVFIMLVVKVWMNFLI